MISRQEAINKLAKRSRNLKGADVVSYDYAVELLFEIYDSIKKDDKERINMKSYECNKCDKVLSYGEDIKKEYTNKEGIVLCYLCGGETTERGADFELESVSEEENERLNKEQEIFLKETEIIALKAVKNFGSS